MSGRHEGETDEVARAQVHQGARENLQVPQAGWRDFFHHYGKLKNFLLLLGTAGSWFCLDVAFHGLSLNNGTILTVIGYSTKNAHNVYEYLYNTAVGNIIIVLAGAVRVIGFLLLLSTLLAVNLFSLAALSSLLFFLLYIPPLLYFFF